MRVSAAAWRRFKKAQSVVLGSALRSSKKKAIKESGVLNTVEEKKQGVQAGKIDLWETLQYTNLKNFGGKDILFRRAVRLRCGTPASDFLGPTGLFGEKH